MRPEDRTALTPFLSLAEDRDALVAALAALTDKERKALSGPVRRAVAARYVMEETTDLGGGITAMEYRRNPNPVEDAVLAVLLVGCVTGVRQLAEDMTLLDVRAGDLTPVIDALRARNPAWLADLPAALLAGDALGLSAKSGDERARAVDAVVDLAAAALLDGPELGTQAQRLLGAEIVTGTRIAAALAEADRATPVAAGPILDALTVLLPTLPGRRAAHLFVDLLAQLATRTGRSVALPGEFAALRTGRSNSALAAACRRVPSH